MVAMALARVLPVVLAKELVGVEYKSNVFEVEAVHLHLAALKAVELLLVAGCCS